MSRDDDDNHTIDYQQAFPVGSRNRKRRSGTSRPSKQEPPLSRFLPKDPPKKASAPKRSHAPRGRRDIDSDGPPVRSMKIVTREMLARDPALRTDDLMERLEAMGYEAAPVTISSIRQDFIEVLRICEAAGTITVHAWRD